MTKILRTFMLVALLVVPWCDDAFGQLLRRRAEENNQSNNSPNASQNRRNINPYQSRQNSAADEQYRNNLQRNAAPQNMYRGQPPANYRAPVAPTRPPVAAVAPLPQPLPAELNTLPNPQQVEPAAVNPSPGLDLIEPIDAETYALASDVVRGQARESIDEMAADFAAAATSPNVQQQLEVLKQKLERGTLISDEDLNKLTEVAVDSGLLPVGTDGRLPAAVERRLNRTLDRLVGLGAANQILGAPFRPSGARPGLPTGTVRMVACPPLGVDQMLLLPGGDILAGTGGVGEFGVDVVNAAEMLGVPLGIGEPVPSSPANTSSRIGSGILILNPAENRGTAYLMIADQRFSMAPGDRKRLPESTALVQFDRGRGNEPVRYTMRDGTYTFQRTAAGWELLRQTFHVTIDNRTNENNFHYNIDNAPQQVAAGQSQSHSGGYPINVRFDRGGSETTKEIAQKDVTLVVAVNPQDGLWDLYASANFPQNDLRAPATRTNSLARSALMQERNRLSGAVTRQRFSTMKPIIGEANRSAKTVDPSPIDAAPESLPSYFTEKDGVQNLLPEPLPE